MTPLQKPDTKSSLVAVRLAARIENLQFFIDPVLKVAAVNGLSEERQIDVELALEEVLVNICNYAYPENPGYATLSCRIAGGMLVMQIEDEGIAFSLTANDETDITSTITERKIGGLGIHLVKSLMDEVRYRREDNRNILELLVSLAKNEVAQ